MKVMGSQGSERAWDPDQSNDQTIDGVAPDSSIHPFGTIRLGPGSGTGSSAPNLPPGPVQWKRCGDGTGIDDKLRPPFAGEGHQRSWRGMMGDKGGKKDKEKAQKQNAEKQKEKAKSKEEKQPKKKP
jgi:hypothetical protein